MNNPKTLLLHGNFLRPCGFTIINHKLAEGLAKHEFQVFQMPNDGPAEPPLKSLPSVYIFHGDPYDFDHAPGEVNAVFLHWEYLQLPVTWVSKINNLFDLVIAPSEHSKQVYLRSGINLPIIVFPAAIDPLEFNPSVTPWPAPTEKTFRFVHLGGAHERRGTDILLQAYADTFSAKDDVTLILKAFHYEHYRGWLEPYLARFEHNDAPEILYLHETLPAVGGVFTAADVGVYPLRAECYGLPVLECIASGRPVIVPRGTGLDQFCTLDNSEFVPAKVEEGGEKTGVLPDAAHLGRLMRAAYVRGKLKDSEQYKVAATVADFTWRNSIASLAEGLKKHIGLRNPKKSSFSYEPYLQMTNGLPLETALELEASERETCGLAPRQLTAFDSWACNLVDKESGLKGLKAHNYKNLGFAEQEVIVNNHKFSSFLFYSRNPFLDGLRFVFEAWRDMNLKHAVLHCVTTKEILESNYLLRILIQQQNIIHYDIEEVTLENFWEDDMCFIFPTLGDALGDLVISGSENGRCLIISPHSIVKETVGNIRVLEDLTPEALSVAILEKVQGGGHPHD